MCYNVFMVRTQILLTEFQSQELRTLAAAERRSMADLVRDGVDALLTARGGGRRNDAKTRALAAAGRFRSGVRDLGTSHDEYLVEALKS
jgi:hypothetical protein